MSNHNGYNHHDKQQFRNHLQKVISKTAKNMNIFYRNTIDINNTMDNDYKVEFLQQKLMKQAEKILSRSEYWKILEHIQSLTTEHKKVFLEQLQRQFKRVRK